MMARDVSKELRAIKGDGLNADAKLVIALKLYSDLLSDHNELLKEHCESMKVFSSHLKEHVTLQKLTLKLSKKIKRFESKDPFKFPNTPSFIVGMCGGTALTAYIAGHPDWWVWVLFCIPCIGYSAWKGLEAEKEAAKIKDETQDQGQKKGQEAQ